MSYTNEELYSGLRDICWLHLQLNDRILALEQLNATLLGVLARNWAGISDDDRLKLLSLSASQETTVEHAESFSRDLKAGFEKLPKTTAKSPFSI